MLTLATEWCAQMLCACLLCCECGQSAPAVAVWGWCCYKAVQSQRVLLCDVLLTRQDGWLLDACWRPLSLFPAVQARCTSHAKYQSRFEGLAVVLLQSPLLLWYLCCQPVSLLACCCSTDVAVWASLRWLGWCSCSFSCCKLFE